MILVLTAIILCAATAYACRNAVSINAPIRLVGFDGIGVILWFIVFIIAATFMNPIFGFSIVVTLVLQEFGHVLAHRMVGHSDARFRLVPFTSGFAISDTPPSNETEKIFIALMGPGICLAPMVLAHTLSATLATSNPEISLTLRDFAIACGTMNFIVLLPFWPLGGGRCTRIFSSPCWPVIAPALAVFFTAMFAAAAWRTGSITLLVLAVIGVQSMFRKPQSKLAPMDANNATTALVAYSFTLAAHFSGGYFLLSQYM